MSKNTKNVLFEIPKTVLMEELYIAKVLPEDLYQKYRIPTEDDLYTKIDEDDPHDQEVFLTQQQKDAQDVFIFKAEKNGNVKIYTFNVQFDTFQVAELKTISSQQIDFSVNINKLLLAIEGFAYSQNIQFLTDKNFSKLTLESGTKNTRTIHDVSFAPESTASIPLLVSFTQDTDTDLKYQRIFIDPQQINEAMLLSLPAFSHSFCPVYNLTAAKIIIKESDTLFQVVTGSQERSTSMENRSIIVVNNVLQNTLMIKNTKPSNIPNRDLDISFCLYKQVIKSIIQMTSEISNDDLASPDKELGKLCIFQNNKYFMFEYKNRAIYYQIKRYAYPNTDLFYSKDYKYQVDIPTKEFHDALIAISNVRKEDSIEDGFYIRLDNNKLILRAIGENNLLRTQPNIQKTKASLLTKEIDVEYSNSTNYIGLPQVIVLKILESITTDMVRLSLIDVNEGIVRLNPLPKQNERITYNYTIVVAPFTLQEHEKKWLLDYQV